MSDAKRHRCLVRFSHKIKKLFSAEVWESLWEHAGRLSHPVNARKILARLDCEEFDRLRERYPYRPSSPRINAFEDARYWVAINIERAQDLWLDRSRPLRILDLGCGAGYFLYVCRVFGHEGLGLDTDNEPLFQATIDLLGVRRVIFRIQPNVPLPALNERFDLVTAHRICFHRIRAGKRGSRDEWKPEQWRFFINDIRTRFLKPQGRLLLDFNPRRDGSSFFTPELRSCFRSEGARFLRSKALFATDPDQHPKFRQLT